MPQFIIETTAEAVIREFWQIEAATAEDARDSFHDGEGYQLLWDETIGDEQNREVAHVHPASDLDGVVAMHRAQQAGPAMLAALRMALTALERSATERGVRHLEAVAVRDAIALATGAPTGETAGDDPTCDDAEAEGLQTYRITETAVYLVKAEDEAHAERRFVCEVGIHAESFHAVEGRTIELAEEGED